MPFTSILANIDWYAIGDAVGYAIMICVPAAFLAVKMLLCLELLHLLRMLNKRLRQVWGQ